MQNLSGIVWRIVCFIGVSTATTMGQTPTFSLELAEINSIPICGGGVSGRGHQAGRIRANHFVGVPQSEERVH